MGESQTLASLWDPLPDAVKLVLAGTVELPSCHALANLFDSEEEMLTAVALAPADVVAAHLEKCKALVQLAADLSDRQVRRRVRVHPSLMRLELERLDASLMRTVEQGSLDWLLTSSGAKRTQDFIRGSDPEVRRRMEEEFSLRWRTRLAEVLQSLNLPISDIAEASQNPQQVYMAAAGAMRGSTIRKRLRAWSKYAEWLLVVWQMKFPTEPEQVIDYLLDLEAACCGVTVPQAALDAIHFMETCGGFREDVRLTTHPLVLRTLNAVNAHLQAGAQATRKAGLIPIMLVVALGLTVVDGTEKPYMRALAWVRLLKLWASLRADDLAGLNPRSLRMTSAGLSGRLERTKASGPGKRVRFLPIYVSKMAYIADPDWLMVGLRIWESPKFSFDRDYFVPLPQGDLTGCKSVMATYKDMLSHNRALLMRLRQPVVNGTTWDLAQGSLLLDGRVALFWTEHSERNWATSVAAALGIARDRREFLGRWRVAGSVEEYLRTAARVVHLIQQDIVVGLKADLTWDLRDAGLDELGDFLKEKGLTQPEVEEQRRRLTCPEGAFVCSIEEETQALEVAERVLDHDPPQQVEEPRSKYFVCISGTRRLHKWFHPRGEHCLLRAP